MSTVFNDHSSDTVRSDRDVIATGTTTVVENFYKAKSLWVADAPPLDATVTDWVIEVPVAP